MNKTIKTIKTIIITIIILAFAVTSFTVLAEIMEMNDNAKLSAEYDELIENIADTSVKVEKTDSFNKMLAFLEHNTEAVNSEKEQSEEVEDPEDLYNEVLYNYFYLKKVHDLTQDELDYISDLIADGCDAYTILDLAYFWLDTSEDISIIEKMYSYRDMYKGKKDWYENAYCRATGYINVLSDEDYEYFLEKGISTDTMYIVNKISRKRIYTTKQILDKVVAGESLAEITYDIENKKNEKFKKAKVKTKHKEKLVADKNIIKSKKLAELTGNYKNMLSEMSEDELDKKIESAQKAVTRSILNSMKNDKIIKNNPDRKNERVFKEKIKAKGVSDVEIENYVKKGYKYVDILNAAEYMTVNNISLEKAIEEVLFNE